MSRKGADGQEPPRAILLAGSPTPRQVTSVVKGSKPVLSVVSAHLG